MKNGQRHWLNYSRVQSWINNVNHHWFTGALLRSVWHSLESVRPAALCRRTDLSGEDEKEEEEVRNFKERLLLCTEPERWCVFLDIDPGAASVQISRWTDNILIMWRTFTLSNTVFFFARRVVQKMSVKKQTRQHLAATTNTAPLVAPQPYWTQDTEALLNSLMAKYGTPQ